MIDWALNTWTDNGDYASNVKIALANEVVPQRLRDRRLGVRRQGSLGCPRERARKAEAEKPESNWIGQIKERIEFTATVVTKQYRGENEYGNDEWLIKMADENGNEIIWWATGNPRVKGESDDPYITEGVTYRKSRRPSRSTASTSATASPRWSTAHGSLPLPDQGVLMQTRHIAVNLSDEAAERYDRALTGNDDDVLLLVEKIIMGRLYPGLNDSLAAVAGMYVDTDPEIVAVEEG
jgi:hypothetical protein